jgi:hyperosmotically inducible periplasmic protein
MSSLKQAGWLAVAGLVLAAGGCKTAAIGTAAGAAAEGGYLYSKDQPVKQTLSDQRITAEVKSRLAVDKDTKAIGINVSTAKGVVTLDGEVRSAEEEQEAIRIAQNTRGVKKVVDSLDVAQ